MYQLANESNISELLAYFEKDLKNCLYSYIDLKKYGIDNKDLKIYYYKENNEMVAVATKYYNGLQLFSCHSSFPVQVTVNLIRELNPTIISAATDIIDSLSQTFSKDYEVEKGFVTSLSKTNPANAGVQVKRAVIEDLEEIARLICSDESLGGHYSVNQLKEQLLTRMKENFGRNYIVRQDGQIVCHSATYAELDNLAVISGVITHPDYRGKGLAKAAVTKLCDDLLSEGKQPHLFYYTKDSERLYNKIGFDSPSNWGKLARH
jgi:N-acetylglutamate synthase-like GNAT family acetyltransferase